MPDDLRDKTSLTHENILDLNFIQAPGAYVYRRHYRTGLRSHIMEVLRPEDVVKETKGTVVDGIRQYPRAQPFKMLRLFRTRFPSLMHAHEEVRRVRILHSHLGSDHMAMSEEFLVDYQRDGQMDFLLCGLQEFVRGEVLEPWGPLDDHYLASIMPSPMFTQQGNAEEPTARWLARVREAAGRFVDRLKRMVMETHHVPDLAGVGNLILAPSGHIKLVDINNISTISFQRSIPLDDMGYPVCDKSIKVMWHLERKVAGRPVGPDDPVYESFLDPGRMKEVQSLEERFHRSMPP